METIAFKTSLYYYLKKLFYIHPEILVSILTKYKAMIAGGFASFIYSSNNGIVEDYNGDIDIWIPIIYEEPKLSTINKIKIDFEQVLSNYTKICEYNFIKIISKHNYYKNIKNKDSNLSDILYIIKFKNDNKEIQLIFTNQSNLDVLSHFDLSFCSIGYDGLDILHPILEQKLSRHKIGYVINKHMQTNKRIIKYQTRGYKIFDDRESALHSLSLIED